MLCSVLSRGKSGQHLVEHAQKEHQQVKDLIAKLPEAEDLDGAMAVLMQHVMHHVEVTSPQGKVLRCILDQ